MNSVYNVLIILLQNEASSDDLFTIYHRFVTISTFYKALRDRLLANVAQSELTFLDTCCSTKYPQA